MLGDSKNHWEPQPIGAAWVAAVVRRFRSLHRDLSDFELQLRQQTGTRLIDWVDHLVVSDLEGIEQAGFVRAIDGWYEHPGALLPVVRKGDAEAIFLRVDSASDFAIANGSKFDIQLTGAPLDRLRFANFLTPNTSIALGVIQRQGCNIRQLPAKLSEHEIIQVQTVRERLRHRRRKFDSEADAFESTAILVAESIREVGRDMTCHLFFEGEREYWQSRNRAGQIQFMRQQSIGVGWGNHDHHTYRSSRASFLDLIKLLEIMGFECREKFHAGNEAGWGAQVIEQSVCGIVIFADVDLDPNEVTNDFSHQPLPNRSELGTIGLWCSLHGEALFQAGMHHLECQFDFDGARTQLAAFGIQCMKPFTDFPFLRQCFTEGERWRVDSKRVEKILSEGRITPEQAARFLSEGAVGSHMEILERNDGYRGFNQTGINEIIRKTDPRFQATDIN